VVWFYIGVAMYASQREVINIIIAPAIAKNVCVGEAREAL